MVDSSVNVVCSQRNFSLSLAKLVIHVSHSRHGSEVWTESTLFDENHYSPITTIFVEKLIPL